MAKKKTTTKRAPTKKKAAPQKTARTPLALGIASIPLAMLPVLGLPIAIIALVLSIKAKKLGQINAQAAFVTSIVGLVLVVINMALGAYLGVIGQLY